MKAEERKGLFCVVEGIDGAGKSTLVAAMAARLQQAGVAVTTTREPGGTALAEQIRAVLKSTEANAAGPPDSATVLLLFEAARCENVAKTIAPALARGDVVISDRYTASTLVYQGECLGSREAIRTLHRLLKHPVPQATVLVDIDAETASRRLARARTEAVDAAALTRLEALTRAYREIAVDSRGWSTVDGNQDSDVNAAAICSRILHEIGCPVS